MDEVLCFCGSLIRYRFDRHTDPPLSKASLTSRQARPYLLLLHARLCTLLVIVDEIGIFHDYPALGALLFAMPLLQLARWCYVFALLAETCRVCRALMMAWGRVRPVQVRRGTAAFPSQELVFDLHHRLDIRVLRKLLLAVSLM